MPLKIMVLTIVFSPLYYILLSVARKGAL